jgi:hypothetical protein
MSSHKSPPITIRDLYPALTPEDCRRAEENIEGYLSLVIRMYNRISQDPKLLAELREALHLNEPETSAEVSGALTERQTSSTMPVKVDPPEPLPH